MERINRKRKVSFLDLYDENFESFENIESFEINKKIDRINLEFKKISITRKRKFDIIQEIIQEEGDKIIQKNKFIKIYSCSLHDNDKEIFWKNFNLVNKNWLNIKKNLNIEYGYELNFFDYNKKISEIINSWDKIKFTIVWEYLVKNGILNSGHRLNLSTIWLWLKKS